VRLGTFDDDQVRRPEAQDLLRRLELAYLSKDAAWSSPSTRVTVRLRDARPLVAEVTRERGSPGDPLTWEELVAKYRDCASRVLAGAQVERSLEQIEDLPGTRIDELARTLTPSGTGDPH
jgi:2-methylcitrate dehydratase PrpD